MSLSYHEIMCIVCSIKLDYFVKNYVNICYQYFWDFYIFYIFIVFERNWKVLGWLRNRNQIEYRQGVVGTVCLTCSGIFYIAKALSLFLQFFEHNIGAFTNKTLKYFGTIIQALLPTLSYTDWFNFENVTFYCNPW